MFDFTPTLSMPRHMLALIACVALSACTPPKIGDESRADLKKISKSTEQLQELARREQKNPAFVVLEEGPRFGARSVNLRAESQLPARLNQVSIQLPGRHSLATVATVLSRTLDLPVVMSPDALMDAAQFSPLGAGSGTTTNPTNTAADRASQAGARTLNITPSDALNTLELNYSGPVVTLLDQIAARAGLYWEYTGGRILFSRVVSRTFAIKSMSPGVKTTGSISLSSSGASGGSSGGSNGSSGLSIEANSETNVWANLEPTLRTMVSNTGKLQIDAPGGSVTVIDALDNVNRIERYVQQLNNSLLRQITLEVEVYQVNLSDDYSNGLSWTALASNLSRFDGGSLRITTPTPSSAASGGAFTLTTGVPGSTRTATAVVSALESFGRVSGVYSGVVTTINRTPVPLGSTTSQSYLRETTPAVVSGSSNTGFTTQAGLVPGTINTGFTMVVTPTILDSNRVLVQTSLEISNLVSLDKFGTDTQEIQLPNISRFVTMQRSNMMAGETLVLTGYERQSTQTDASDVVKGVLPASRSGKRQRESLVILITPRLQDI